MKQKLTLYYDQECPFCSSYANFVKLNDHFDLQVKNSRVCHSEIRFLCKHIDINDGLVISVDGTCMQGIDALRYLDIAMEKKGLLSRLHGIWNLKKTFTKPIYTFIKMLRKMVLFLMGKKRHIE